MVAARSAPGLGVASLVFLIENGSSTGRVSSSGLVVSRAKFRFAFFFYDGFRLGNVRRFPLYAHRFILFNVSMKRLAKVFSSLDLFFFCSSFCSFRLTPFAASFAIPIFAWAGALERGTLFLVLLVTSCFCLFLREGQRFLPVLSP